MTRLPVLYEDNHLLVVNKPSGLPTMGATGGSPTVVTLAAAYLRDRYQKPGNVFVGVVSRLDRLVSGVLVLARTSKAASRLSDQIRQRATEKQYRACVEGVMEASEWTEVEDWVSKDETHHCMRIVGHTTVGAQQAKLRWRTAARLVASSLLEIELITGRKHQIRLQLSQRGHPILGDQKYGAHTRFARGIALHCHRLVIKHPTRDEQLIFTAPVPDYWPKV